MVAVTTLQTSLCTARRSQMMLHIEIEMILEIK